MYSVSNWYWFVAGDKTRVYSSSAAAYVDVNNSSYIAWAEMKGHFTSNIDSEESLQEVFSQQYPAGWPQLAIKQELADLDALLPRSLENFWEVTSFDTTKLRANHLAILHRKQSLRASLT